MTITPEREAALIASVPTGLLINGEWRDASDGGTFDVFDPATGEKLATLASATSEDAMAALDAADAVQASWALTAPRERAEILRRAFDMVTARADDFALLMSLEMGKPVAEARGEVTYGAEFLRWFSEETVRDYGRYLTTPEGKNKMIVQTKPVGPCLLITPWNFPLAMATRKVAPAIAAGCTMVLKPAKLTPLTSQLFAAVMMEAGLPAGVLNVVSSASASKISGPLMADSRLRKVSFTGSTAVGKMLMKDATENVLRTSMELGGNAPFLVFEDADLDAAVEGAMAAKMRNMGEACTAANRFLVHESVAEEFTAKFAAAMGALKTGRGTEPTTNVGPLIDGNARDDVHALVVKAIEAGASRDHRRRAGGRPGLLLPADRADQRRQRRRDPAPGNLRPGCPDHHLPRRGTRHRTGQRQRVRFGFLRLHQGPQPPVPRGREDRIRPGWLQRRRHLQRGGTVRWREAVRPGP